ncbi:hypothetical protein BO71DRAFT_223995 [Aspergillus ellipticus CBS 707.79]|uniref:Uncharacterized protein n=1 Tax=Aspergillus ellipticus CBS 707.79 TaxID=1448320 RepID=A0A319DPB0_9EURO|nr:hypothetical protein BO71DRAFT_223995 [Aspergillus ellipticus CBS 707.79]
MRIDKSLLTPRKVQSKVKTPLSAVPEPDPGGPILKDGGLPPPYRLDGQTPALSDTEPWLQTRLKSRYMLCSMYTCSAPLTIPHEVARRCFNLSGRVPLQGYLHRMLYEGPPLMRTGRTTLLCPLCALSLLSVVIISGSINIARGDKRSASGLEAGTLINIRGLYGVPAGYGTKTPSGMGDCSLAAVPPPPPPPSSSRATRQIAAPSRHGSRSCIDNLISQIETAPSSTAIPCC